MLFRARFATLLVASAVALIVVGCHELAAPDATKSRPIGGRASVRAAARTLDDVFEAIDRDAPGFGGLYLDEGQNPVIAITSGASRAAAEAAVRTHMGRMPGRAGGGVQYVTVAYRFSDLRRWLTEFVATWRRDGITMVDVNERRNRIVIGVRDGAVRAAILEEIARSEVPIEAVNVDIRSGPITLSTLQDLSRPVVGGLRIQILNWSSQIGHECTLGFNVKLPGDTALYGVTNSHCTSVQGNVSNDSYYQPHNIDSYPNRLGVEYADPSYVAMPNEPQCFYQHLCRSADAALIRYDTASQGAWGKIARPTSYGYGGQGINLTRDTVDFALTGEADTTVLVSGQWVSKVGRTTGWTAGQIDESCVGTTVGLVGGNYLGYLCQYNVYDFMNAGRGNFVAGGDSGSPAFITVYSEDDVYGGVNWLAGIVFAGDTIGPSNKDRFWFSPLIGIRTDLGSMTTVPGGGCIPNQYLTGCQ